jgi:adenylate cyclase class 2
MANDTEIEVKFYLLNLPVFEQRLQALGARLTQPRVYELNLRFDTPQMDLAAEKRILRLRRDQRAVMTYKGPNQARDDVAVRQEIEFTVSDFGAARRFLEALGYSVSVSYEKYRAIYALGDLVVTLDEMPFGNFAEIEGPGPRQIQAIAQRLGLDWAQRVRAGYLALFDHVKAVAHLDVQDLSFANFAGLEITPEQLGVIPADEGK